MYGEHVLSTCEIGFGDILEDVISVSRTMAVLDLVISIERHQLESAHLEHYSTSIETHL